MPARLPLNEPVLRPTFRRERRWLSRGVWPVAGCDEVGRGPLAGPVVAAAVILDPANIPEGLDDSKRLSHLQREALFLNGGYTAVRTTGVNGRNLIAFARRHGGEAVVTVAPRLIGAENWM